MLGWTSKSGHPKEGDNKTGNASRFHLVVVMVSEGLGRRDPGVPFLGSIAKHVLVRSPMCVWPNGNECAVDRARSGHFAGTFSASTSFFPGPGSRAGGDSGLRSASLQA